MKYRFYFFRIIAFERAHLEFSLAKPDELVCHALQIW